MTGTKAHYEAHAVKHRVYGKIKSKDKVEDDEN